LWQQDAARRLFQKPEGLAQADFDDLYALLKASNNLPNPLGLTPTPLSKAHIPTSLAHGGIVALKSMHDLKDVNCIAPNQSLSFEVMGITVIYGGNGSGKSGYARVMKKACRARDQEERVLPDANDPSSQARSPEAVFEIDANGTAQSIHWSSQADPPEELASIAVFDHRCARQYLTKEQEVAYLPYGLDIVESLADRVLPELERRLDSEISSISTDSQAFAHLEGDTEVGRVIAHLTHETDPEILRTLGKLSDEEVMRLEELDRTLGEADPASKARELHLSAGRLRDLAKRVDAVVVHVGETAIARLKTAAQESYAADLAEKAAATHLHSGDQLLPGTGEPIWKALYEAARRYSTEQAYPGKPFPNLEPEALCLLCQQPLDGVSERLSRFEKYVQDDVAKAAARKKLLLDKEVKALKEAMLDVGVKGAIAAELDQLDSTLCPHIDVFEKSLQDRRVKLLAAIPALTWDTVPELASNPRQALRDLAAKQHRSARDYERASDRAKSQILRKERDALFARKSLSLCVEQVESLLGRLKKKVALEGCKKDLNTRPISMKARELASVAVTAALKDAVDVELNALGMSHIKTKLRDRNVKGRILHQLLLDVPTSSKVEDILSEGEQRAIAIASFLAELRLANHSAAIIFDDPVSSLDHLRRRRVALRLAEESRSRQVIIFTHDIVFLHQLQSECSFLGLSIGLRFLEKKGKHAGNISAALPWDHKSFGDRIDGLEKVQKKFEKLPWPPEPHEELAREMIQQYSFLRATIERVVQDYVLNATVRRFEDYIQVSHLQQVVGLEQSEVDEILRLYQRCHDIVEAHDPASAVNGPPPTAAELGADISALRAVIGSIKIRRAQMEQFRKHGNVLEQ
jgi:energy-coupling factor transporter ATP-binding protein EcfA2